MPSFRYRARDKYGAVFSGRLETAGKEAVAAQLDTLGYYPVSIQEERYGFHLDFSALLNRFQPIRAEEMIIFTRQLSTLIGAGIPFLPCFDALAEQTSNRKLREIIVKIRREIEGGSSFSDALSKFPAVFSPLYVNMVRAGEAGGVLDEILERLALFAEHDAQTRARIKAATLYPKIVIGTIAIAFVFLVMVVIPKFAAAYNDYHATLPLPTRILIETAHISYRYGLLILGAAVGALFAFKRYIQSPHGRYRWDGFKLKVPIFGVIFSKIALSRFARVFGVLTRAGLPLLQTLDIVSGTVGNVVLSRVVDRIREAAREGRGIIEPMRMSKVFPPLVLQMVAVGEESGRMEQMMGKVSEYYDRDVDYAIRNLSTTLEPILLVIIGGAVLFLALAIFLPWWNLVNVAKGG